MDGSITNEIRVLILFRRTLAPVWLGVVLKQEPHTVYAWNRSIYLMNLFMDKFAKKRHGIRTSNL